MKTPYAWRCFKCDSSNVAEENVCAFCGFPARATGGQIEAARATPYASNLSEAIEASRKPSIGELLAPLSPWRRTVAVTGMLLFGGGLLWLKVTFSLTEAAVSVGASIAGLLVMGLAFAGAELPPVSAAPESLRNVGSSNKSAATGHVA
jgi:hypothetical protein